MIPTLCGGIALTSPANPINWSKARRWGTIYVVSALTFIVPLASSMFAPGVPDVMAEFKSDDQQLESFVVSVFVLGFAFGPLVIAPLSELYGRIPIYNICNLMFVLFSLACALAKDMPSFIIFRFLEGVFGSCPLTVGGGTIADVTKADERGTAMAIWMMGPTVGPAVGPVIGGFLSETLGWRWAFWLITIVSGVFSLASAFLMRETYAPVILNHKVERLRKETGNSNLRSKLQPDMDAKSHFAVSIVRPIKLLFTSPLVLLTAIYLAVCYGYLYLMFTTFTNLFQTQYGFNRGTVGLTYLGLGIGSLLGQIYCTWLSNRTYAMASQEGTLTPEVRLKPVMIQGAVMLPVGFLWYGWSAQVQTHWIVPILGTALIGASLVSIFLPASTYLVDSFTLYAASSLAAVTVLRSLCGAFIPLAGRVLYEKLGVGWGNSLLAFIALFFISIPLVFIRYGSKLRSKGFNI